MRVVILKGSMARVATPNFRHTSMAPFSEVPASSTKLSGLCVYSSVSLEAIQT